MDENQNHLGKHEIYSFIESLISKLDKDLKDLESFPITNNKHTYLILCLDYAKKIKKQLTFINSDKIILNISNIDIDNYNQINEFIVHKPHYIEYEIIKDFLCDLYCNLESILIGLNTEPLKSYKSDLYKLKSENENLNKILIDYQIKLDEKILNADNVISEIKQDYALSGFDELYRLEASNQSEQSKEWMKFTKCFLAILMGSIAICFIFNLATRITSYVLICNEIAFNFILLSVTLWCAKMYIHSKSLEINYTHKSISSRALLPLVTSIKETSSEDISNIHIKNTILLESSRMIFAPPETSLNKKDSQIDNKLLETIRDVSTMTKKD